MIELKNIIKEYDIKNGKVRALDDVTLTFNSAGLVLITGENGCGKSTLMNLIGSIDTPTSGSIKIDGEEIDYANFNLFKQTLEMAKRTRNVSFIYQTPNLIESMTLESNLEMARLGGKITIADALARVGLKGKGRRLPSELSIGQMQRACIARAIIRDSDIILADEPTASLDPKMREDIIGYLHELAKDRLVIVITHNESEFYDCSRKIVMDKGKIVQDTTYRSAERKSCGVQRNEKPKWKPLMQSARMKVRKNVFRFSFNLIMLIIFFAGAVVVFNINGSTAGRLYKASVNSNENGYALYSGSEKNLSGLDYIKGVNMPLVNDNFLPHKAEGADEPDLSIVPTYYKAIIIDGNYENNLLYPMPMTMLSEENVIGRLPVKGDEVVVTRYFADCMIYYNNKYGDIYEDYDDILLKGYIITADNASRNKIERRLKIVGIKDDDMQYFDVLKKHTDSNSEEISAIEPFKNETNYIALQFIDKVEKEYKVFYCHGDYNDTLYKNYVNKYNPLIKGAPIYSADNFDYKLYGKWENGDVMVALSDIIKLNDYTDMVGETTGEEKEKLLINFADKLVPIDYTPEKRVITAQRDIDVKLGLKYKICGFYDDFADRNAPKVRVMHKTAYEETLKAAVSQTNYIAALIPLNTKENINGTLELAKIQSERTGTVYVVNSKFVTITFENMSVIDETSGVTEIIGFYLNIAGICFMLCIVLFIIYSVVLQFKRYSDDIGMLMCLGTKMRHIVGFIISEFVITMLIGLITGLCIGIITVAVYNHFLFVGLFNFSFTLIGWQSVLFVIGSAALIFMLTLLNALIGISAKSPMKRLRDKA